MTLTLNITPIAFDLAEFEWLPSRKPYLYQKQVYQLVEEALRHHKTLCLFLVTPTGSGKTLASYAYAINHHIPAFGVYPTNELIRDQENSLKEWFNHYDEYDVLRIDSKQLDDWQSQMGDQAHAQTFEKLLNWRRTILTNPDILFYTFFGLYGGSEKKADNKPDFFAGINQRLYNLVMAYQLFIFDEFHLYNIKQMADVAFLIGTIQAINPNKGRVFIFASATPEIAIRDWLKNKLNLLSQVVEAEPSNEPEARLIAHPVELTLVPADLKGWQGPEALLTHLPILQQFVATYPQARIVTILDSVAGAISVTQTFHEAFPGKSVGEVHGFSSDEEREQALKQEITVGTSTIEVGIDFKDATGKDVLLYEARAASQFIQRFGRLARHGKNLAIPNKVVAFVPEYVYNFFNEKLQNGTTISRPELYDLTREAYKIPQDFANYLHKHAPAEFQAALSFIERMFQQDDQIQVVEGIKNAIQALTDQKADRASYLHKQYLKKQILKPLLTFRGNGFEAGIIDDRGIDIGFPVKRYNLMFLLRRGLFTEIDEETYLQRLDSMVAKWPKDVAREKRYSKRIGTKPEDLLGVYGYFLLTGLLDKGRQVYFEIDEDEIQDKVGEITTISGLEVATEPELGIRIRNLNKYLSRKQIVAWFVPHHPAYIKLGHGLPPLFEVYKLRIRRWHTLSQPYSIVFNQDAFFIDSLSSWYKEKRENRAIIL